MTTIDEVRQFVGKEATLAELAELDTLIGHARRARAAVLPNGTRVKLANIRPKYIAGLTGTVVGRRNERILVNLDVPQDRFANPIAVPVASVVTV